MRSGPRRNGRSTLLMHMLVPNHIGHFQQDNASDGHCWVFFGQTKKHYKEVLTWPPDLLNKQAQSTQAPTPSLGLKGSVNISTLVLWSKISKGTCSKTDMQYFQN